MLRPADSTCVSPTLAFALAGSWAGVLALLLAAAGCSDNGPIKLDASASDASASTSTDAADLAGPSCPDDSGPVDPTSLIDDFEHATSVAPLLAGRMGGWYAAGDATVGAIMQPLGDAPPEPIPGGRCGSRHALHVTGSGFLDWGSLVSLTLNYGANDAGISGERPYDAGVRGYQGVTFFARVGDTSTTTVRFTVSDEFARPEAGLCTLNGSIGNNCYDTYGVWLTQTLTTDWQQFRIPWTGLSQQNFGLPGGLGPDVSQIYDMGFTFPERAVFDLWVDDMRFY